MDNLSNYKDMCRVCLTQPTHIFILTDLEAKQLFELCTSVRTTDDHFPTRLCANCSNQLISWSAFRSTAMNSDRRLKEFLINDSSTKDKDIEMEEKRVDCVSGERREAKESNAKDSDSYRRDRRECVELEVPVTDNQIDNEGDIESNLASFVVFLSGESNSQTAQESTNSLLKSSTDFSAIGPRAESKTLEESSNGLPASTYSTDQMKYHSDEHPFKCVVCGISFKDKSNLVNHELYTHGMQTLKPRVEYDCYVRRSFRCEICSKEFPTKAHLKDHKKFHNDKRKATCERNSSKIGSQILANLLQQDKFQPFVKLEPLVHFHCQNDYEESESSPNSDQYANDPLGECVELEEMKSNDLKHIWPTRNESFTDASEMRSHMSTMHPMDYKTFKEGDLRTQEEEGIGKRFHCETGFKELPTKEQKEKTSLDRRASIYKQSRGLRERYPIYDRIDLT